MDEKIMVVDGNNVLVRAIKAMERANLSSSAGVHTGALLSFINCMGKYVRNYSPDRLAVCWDGGKSKYRSELFPAYKADRPERNNDDEDERRPFALAKQFLTLSNIHHIEMPHVEADDLIAAYWRGLISDDELFILSGDKDFFQLLSGNVTQLRPGPDDVWDRARVFQEMGCLPEDVPKVMALTGDTSDGVPGVPGFGTKTAVKYLAAHDWSLTTLLGNPQPKFAAKVDGQLDRVVLNLQLVDLRKDRIGIELFSPPVFDPTMPGKAMFPELMQFLQTHEMASVMEKMLNGSLWKSPGQYPLTAS